MDNDKRNIDIELIRVFAIVAIMALHFQEDFLGERPFFGGGYLGVDIFFMLAGFFCFKQFCKNNGRTDSFNVYRHGIKRIKKLWPPYIIAVILWLILIFFQNNFNISFMMHHLWGTKYQWLWLNFLSNAGGHEFRTLWYMPVLFWTELLIVYLLYRNCRNYLSVAPCLGVFLMAFLAHNFESLSMQGEWIYIVQGGIVRAFAEMTIGCVSCHLCEIIDKDYFSRANKEKDHRFIWGGIKLFCFLNIFIVMFAFGFDKTDFWIIPNAFVLITLCGLKPTRFPESVSRVVLYISKHVYWLYLLHLLVSKLLTDYFHSLNIWLAIVLFYIFSFGFSIVMRKFYMTINRLLQKKEVT